MLLPPIYFSTLLTNGLILANVTPIPAGVAAPDLKSHHLTRKLPHNPSPQLDGEQGIDPVRVQRLVRSGAFTHSSQALRQFLDHGMQMTAAKRGNPREEDTVIENVVGMFPGRARLQLPLPGYWLPDIEDIH